MAHASDDQTPLMKQYWELKSHADNALLLFRMGDFYELFGDDAVEAARILDITLTSRDKNKANPMPMAGVPHHSIQGYIQRLLKAGKKVAIGDQMEDPATVKGNKIVRREITRIFTPAVQFDAEGSEANYLATAIESNNQWILACLDASTGEALVSEPLHADKLAQELAALPIRHYLRTPQNLPHDIIQLLSSRNVLIEDLPSNYLTQPRAAEILKTQYGIDQLGAFLTADSAILALSLTVYYALRTQKLDRLAHLRLPLPLRKPKSLSLGPNTAEHLDLNDLFTLINRTRSALGARQLRRWLHAPLKAPKEIAERQSIVTELSQQNESAIDKLSSALGEVYDLERISGRIHTNLANPRDSLALGRSLASLPSIQAQVSKLTSPVATDFAKALQESQEALASLTQRILQTQKEEAPLTSKDGGIFKRGTTPDLDHLLTLTEDGERWLVELEAREREATGISSLKVRYNRVFGYYIEITSAHLKNVPAHYQRKQTMVGAERFFTEELKKFEEEILTASMRRKALEQEIFSDLVTEIREQTPAIMETARLLGELDGWTSLARLARQPGWAFPIIDESLDLHIEAGRHPMVDANSGGAFVPNDLQLSPDSRLTLLITGPNMGGKSTVMRQTALIVILGQMGAPVPASQARWGSVDSIYTRIGAQDAIARGQSTFMVEMTELAHILHHANERSLIVLDEIGRGTSTYDGMSVAWATLEWICGKIQARTLFATHYHELTRLAGALPKLANAHMAVEGSKGAQDTSFRFLYLLQEGPANESFGIHVARLAGLPKPVIDRAWKVLDELESQSVQATSPRETNQLSLFDFNEPQIEAAPELLPPHPVLQELEATNINELTPIQALNFVVRLQELNRSESERA